MPKLKGLACSVKWADTGTAFQEYGICYGDGVVESYIVVPDRPQPFTIHLTSQAFIYEGLAAVVFIDGHYQTNRIRVNLLPAKRGVLRERSELDLTIRQKEKPLGDGLYMGRAWRFDDHNIVPTLPPGVTNSHFEELGTIEVIVLRCSSRNIDETNESTTSSAAQSDILEALEHNLEASTADAENDKGHALKNDQSTAKAAKEEDEEPLPFSGIFDGPSDYGRAPHPPPDPRFGQWSWPPEPSSYPHQTSYGPRPSGPSGGYGNRPSQGPNHLYEKDHGFTPEQYSKPPPAGDHPPRSEKRVHFDYGRDQGPTADHARYWDGPDRPRSNPRAPPYSNDRYYTPGLSEWYGNHPEQFEQRWRRDYAPHEYNMQGGGGYAPQGRYHDVPPPQYGYPPYQPEGPTHAPQPSPGAYPWWTGAQPAPPWSTHPVQGAPQAGPPRYYHPQAPPYQPYAGMPNPNAAWPKADSGQNAQAQDQDGIQKSGSLDPAKDENNPSDANQTGNGGKQDGWSTNDSNQNNNTNGTNDNNSNWGDGDNNNNSGDTNNSNDNNDANDGADSNKPDTWGDNTANQGTGLGWDNTNDQNNNTQGDWDNNNNNDTSKTASGGDGWANDTRKASATFSQASGSGIRTLYGPHGAYYAMQFSAAPTPDVQCDAEEEPRYDVPQSVVDEFGSLKQVQPGKGYLYYKKRTHPEYIDRLQEPYARFVFTYMMKHQVEQALSINIDTEPSGNPEVQTLQNMAKDELIQMVIRAQGALGGEIPPPPPKFTDAGEDAPIKGVPISPPKQDFLTYDMPALRGGKGGGGGGSGAKGAAAASKESNDGWASATAGSANNSTNISAAAWDADPKQQFPRESWDQAREQQKSGPPPAPPPRTDTQTNNTGTGDSWDAAPSAAEAKTPTGGW